MTGMNVEKFFQSRQQDWQQLSTLLDRSQKHIEHLSPQDVKQISALYRSVTSDLALAQREFPRHKVTQYLNQLVARGHAVVYQSEPMAIGRLHDYVRVVFPRTFRETLPFFITAALLMLIPALLSGLLMNWMPGAAEWLLPQGVQSLIPQIENQELWTKIPVAERPYVSSAITTNNIQVSFLAFGGGMLAGLLTVYVMIFNGLLLGGLTGLTAHYDIGFELWTFIIGHGVIELSTIFIASGSGLMLGWSMIHPGLLRRRDALTLSARKAVNLIIGCIPLLMIAGLIEGFISPNESIPWPVKWGVGIGTGILLYSYLLLSGKSEVP
ncbi:MAG: stage II sporulation protein M [Chloroflexi bacterium]|nr:MAG: stage II sporulation protein M [Chloroflexota bacterium]